MAEAKWLRDDGERMMNGRVGHGLRRTFDFDDALLAIHGRMSVCGGAWHMFLGVPLGDGH